jgi:RAB protein geranylgeranyltransferase component A
MITDTMKKYEIEIGDLGILPYQSGDRILVKVDTTGLSQDAAEAKLLEVQDTMSIEFPDAKVITHPKNIQLFVLPIGNKWTPHGGKIITVETIEETAE